MPLLENPEFEALWLKTPAGRTVYFAHGDAPLPPDADTVRQIEANGKTFVIDMWANIDPRVAAVSLNELAGGPDEHGLGVAKQDDGAHVHGHGGRHPVGPARQHHAPFI